MILLLTNDTHMMKRNIGRMAFWMLLSMLALQTAALRYFPIKKQVKRFQEANNETNEITLSDVIGNATLSEAGTTLFIADNDNKKTITPTLTADNPNNNSPEKSKGGSGAFNIVWHIFILFYSGCRYAKRTAIWPKHR